MKVSEAYLEGIYGGLTTSTSIYKEHDLSIGVRRWDLQGDARASLVENNQL